MSNDPGELGAVQDEAAELHEARSVASYGQANG